MSYVLQVWESPMPTSLEDADDILGRLLADKVVRPRLRLMALAKALWNQFPSDPYTAPNDPIWVDSSLSKPHDGSPLLTLGIATKHLGVMVPSVAAAASANGLTVYDPQYGTVYLPDGRTFGNLPAPPGKGDTSLDKDEARELAARHLTPFMQAHGFEWVPFADTKRYVKCFEGGGHRIMISPKLFPKYVELVFISATHLEKIDDVAVGLGLVKDGNQCNAMLCHLAAVAKKGMPAEAARWLPDDAAQFRTAGRSSLPATCRDVESAMHSALLPLLNRVQNIESLWAFALEQSSLPEEEQLATLSSTAVIICGWLLRDERYHDIAVARRQELAANFVTAAKWGNTSVIEEDQAKFEKFMVDLEALPT